MYALVNAANATLKVSQWGARSVEFFSFKYDFVFDALVASMIVGSLCGMVGSFLVLKGMSLLGDAAGHSSLPGLCVAFLLTGSLSFHGLFIGAIVAAFLSALFVGAISRGPRTRPDAAIGIVLSVFFGLGIVLLSYIQRTATTSYAGLDSLLLGNVAGITSAQLYTLMVVAVVLSAMTALFFRPIAMAIFDETFAASVGIPTRFVHYGLIVSLAVSVVVSLQAVGVVLVSAMLIIPASAGLFLSRRLIGVMTSAMVIGALSGMAGAYFSYIQEGIATGPAMVLVASVLFGLCMVFGPRQGIIARARKKRAQRLTVGEVSHAV